MNKEKSYIWITTQKEGYHYWDGAKDSVQFLKNIHRHIFNFRVDIEVKHNEREIEFFTFKKFINEGINEVWRKYNLDFCDENNKGCSCETISDGLYSIINKWYKDRDVIIEISEDKENGSRKIYSI